MKHFSKFLIFVLSTLLILSIMPTQAAIQTVTLSSGASASVHCDTTLSFSPLSANDVTVVCADRRPATPTPTQQSTAQPTTAPTVNPTATVVNPTATVNPTVVPTTNPTPTQVINAACRVPYSADSPWNTPIDSSPVYDPQWQTYITALAGTFGSDPTQYTYPLYSAGSQMKTVKFSGIFSNVTENDTKTINQSGGTWSIPIPDGAVQSQGSDANLVVWNQETGDEWGLWQASANSDGTWNAKNGYHYNTNWDGSPGAGPSHFVSRGAGMPYLAGLIRPCEIAQGHIDHAIAFAYDYPTGEFIYPATKSDGSGTFPDMPEGTRLQLNPGLTDQQIQGLNCTNSCFIIAKALQKYGMIVVDKSGHPKIYPEYEGTAHWNGTVKASTPSVIPYSQFRVLKIN